jgi:AraC-like DNA-binding protein
MGLIHGQPFHSTPATKDGDIMMTVVVAGRGRFLPEHGARDAGSVPPPFPVEGGSVGLVFGHEGGVLMSDPEEPYLHYYTRFRGAYAEALVTSIRRAHANSGFPFFPCDSTDRFAELLHRHGRINRRELPGRSGDEGLTVLRILETLARSGDDQGAEPPRAESFDHQLREYLFEHVADPTDLDRIASDLAVSRSALTRRTRSSTGASVGELHRQIKLDWAGRLLRATGAPIGEIAARVGFPDPFYFSRVFRAELGASPRESRRDVRPSGPT